MVYLKIKRILDVVLSLAGLTIVSPVLLLTALAVKIESKGPVIFRQERLGLKGRVFSMYKFRSMHAGAEKGGVYEKKGDARVTRVGRFIRAISMDEAPQFFNVIKGDMSIIGPRPVLTYHPWPFQEYTDIQQIRFKVRPGISGWAQVNGRKDLPWERRIEYDVEYVSNLSFLLDVKIFFRTIGRVFTARDNINTAATSAKNN